MTKNGNKLQQTVRNIWHTKGKIMCLSNLYDSLPLTQGQRWV